MKFLILAIVIVPVAPQNALQTPNIVVQQDSMAVPATAHLDVHNVNRLQHTAEITPQLLQPAVHL